MCGIFGAVIGPRSVLLKGGDGYERVARLFRLSASRGKEAAGLAIANDASLAVFKEPLPAQKMIRMPELRRMVDHELRRERPESPLGFIGHSRLVTDGAREVNRNNQPVVSSGIVGIHNGIIVNHDELWAKHTDMRREFDVDSEVIFALLRSWLRKGDGLAQAAGKTFAELEGAASVAALLEDRDELLLATNNGSLYHHTDVKTDTFYFASERYILRTLLEVDPDDIEAVHPGHGLIVDLTTLEPESFRLEQPVVSNGVRVRATPRRIVDLSPEVEPPRRSKVSHPDFAAIAARFPHVSTTDRLRRCTRCVLPDSMPFIEFDEQGVCNYCRNWQPLPVRGLEALEEIIAPYRRSDGRPDCVVGVSGGRDSMYGLHFIKTVLKLNPVAFTYDWGMVTDLARRNVSRICGKLGIEHILVSADIDQKRSFIRKNVEAWLAKPSLGTIPLFMAGDKAYFHHMNEVRDQVGAPLGFFCENLYERTDFKTGFAGVRPQIVDDVRAYTIGAGAKAKLAAFYLKEFIRNPRYLNSSLLDSALAFVYYYVIKRDYYNLYGYTRWDEPTVVRTLIDEYDFELAPDTETTWRIGDGTAAFYNYIYHSIAGFSENDTLRSNQIREGVLGRDEAMRLIERDNHPRFPSIQWYLDVLGIERSLEEVVEIIQRAPKLYTFTR